MTAGDEQYLLIHPNICTSFNQASRNSHCGICKETKAWYDALVFEEIIDLVQQALELS